MVFVSLKKPQVKCKSPRERERDGQTGRWTDKIDRVREDKNKRERRERHTYRRERGKEGPERQKERENERDR